MLYLLPYAVHFLGVGTLVRESPLGYYLAAVQFIVHPVNGDAVHFHSERHGLLHCVSAAEGRQQRRVYVPFSEYNLYGDKTAASYYSETSFAINASYNFLAGYNFKGIALGFNVRGSWRSMPDYTDNQTDEIKSGSGLSQSALGLMADAGLLMRFNFIKLFNSTDPNLTFGLALNNIGLAFTGLNTEFELDDSLPTRVSAGLSYRLFKPVLFTAEFRKPVNLLDFKSSETWSLASGAEFNITKFFDFELGFCLQFSAGVTVFESA